MDMQDILNVYCEPQLFPLVDLNLYTVRRGMDRFDIGNRTFAGPHDGGMAMWAEPFEGGLAMAQYIWRHPEKFKGKRVLDVGTGSGIVAISAARAGAKVKAIDSNAWSPDVARINAGLNGVTIEAEEGCGTDPYFYEDIDIVTASDVFYVHKDFRTLIEMLKVQAIAGKSVYVTSQDEDLSKLMDADAMNETRFNGNRVLCLKPLQSLAPPRTAPSQAELWARLRF